MSYKVEITGVKTKTVKGSAHTWFSEKKTVRVVARKNGVVTASVDGKYSEDLITKWVNHLARNKHATDICVLEA